MLGPDLMTALIVIASLTVLAYLAGRHLGKHVCGSRSLLFAESLLLALVFAWFFSGELLWANAVGTSGVVCWANFMPPLLALSAGLASASHALARWRRPLTVGVLVAMAIGYLAMPLARPLVSPVDLREQSEWRDGVCLQSHESTCAPAAAATLLNLSGVPATEKEMIDYCLTSNHGTEPLGLFRGLKLATAGYAREARIASKNPAQWDELGQFPNIALVKFRRADQRGAVNQLLGPRGEGHAIVVLGRDQGRWVLADPAVGKIVWSNAEFRSRFTGDAIYLLHTKPSTIWSSDSCRVSMLNP